MTSRGYVRNGVVELDVPLPEGAEVDVRVMEPVGELDPALAAEFAGWELVSSAALARCEEAMAKRAS